MLCGIVLLKMKCQKTRPLFWVRTDVVGHCSPENEMPDKQTGFFWKYFARLVQPMVLYVSAPGSGSDEEFVRRYYRRTYRLQTYFTNQ